MADIFTPFMSGFQFGNQQGEDRRRRNAMSDAGRLYAAGDGDGAENALIAAGLPEEAGQFSQLAQARTRRRSRTAVASAVQGITDPTQRAQAGATAAYGAGDVELGADFDQHWSTLDTQGRERAAQRTAQISSIAGSLLNVPVEQRPQAAMQAAIAAGIPEADAQQFIGQITDWSDQSIQGIQQRTLTAAQQMDFRYRQERDVVEDRFRERSLSIQARNAGGAPLTFTQRNQLRQQYTSGQGRIQESLGIMGPALPYAMLLLRGNGQAPGLSPNDQRLRDIGLLRGVARAQTGPGVLTQAEVLSTLTPSLQQQIRQQGAFFDPSRITLTPEDRLSLARAVLQSARTAQRDSWDLYESATAVLPEGTAADEVGLIAPRMVHPDDVAALTSSARNDYQVGREYTAPSGRTYRYTGPGAWEFTRQGTFQRGYRDPRFAQGGAGAGAQQPTPAQIAELRQHANDPAAIASFNAHFGAGAAQRALGGR